MNTVHHKSHHGHRHERDKKFLFNVNQVSLEDEVMDSELRLYRDLTFDIYPANWTYTLSIYQVMRSREK